MTVVIDGTNGISGVDGTASNPVYEGTDSNTGIFFPAADTVAIGTNGSERVRVDTSGIVLTGLSSALTVTGAATWQQQLAGTGASGYVAARFSNNANPARFLTVKSRGASVGTNTIVQDGDELGSLDFAAADGTSYTTAARISAFVDGTPGTGDLPSRLVFSTAADGAATLTDHMFIKASGNVGIGTSSLVAGARLTVVGGGTQLSGGTTAQEGLRFQRIAGAATITGINNDNNAYNDVALYAGASEGARLTTGNNFQFNSGYGSVATAYGCRAWATFTPSTGTILASGNMTSITRNSAGNYTANFTNAMPDENYAMALGIANDGAGNSRNYYGVTSKTASAYRFSANANGVAFDPPNMSVAIFR
jgi:hypothetical protein